MPNINPKVILPFSITWGSFKRNKPGLNCKIRRKSQSKAIEADNLRDSYEF